MERIERKTKRDENKMARNLASIVGEIAMSRVTRMVEYGLITKQVAAYLKTGRWTE